MHIVIAQDYRCIISPKKAAADPRQTEFHQKSKPNRPNKKTLKADVHIAMSYLIISAQDYAVFDQSPCLIFPIVLI